MSAWNEGYVSDINYTYGYYSELSPQHLTVPFLAAGYAPPQIGVACELGFGQGLSINIHAASQDSTWYGTDFNPSQAQFAQNLVDISGADAHLVDQAFEEFCHRDDLPVFDYISLHGIWSWISTENQYLIVDFIRRKLKVGGALYISYNTLPGWSMYAPLRHLATEHAKVMGAKGTPSNTQAGESLQFTKQIIESSPALQHHIPNITNRITQLTEQNTSYLAHEYFNQDWQPMYFSEIAALLDNAKLSFVSCANVVEDYPATTYLDSQRDILNQISDVSLHETTKDFFLSRQFRKDYWVKGGLRLTGSQLADAWDKLHIIMIDKPTDDTLKLQGAIGSVNLLPELYQPLLDLLAVQEVHSVKSLRAKLSNTKADHLHEMLKLLIGKGTVLVAQDKDQINKATPRCLALNTQLLKEAADGRPIGHLASPVTGGGVAVNGLDQLFVEAHLHGKKKPADIVAHAWTVLHSQNKLLIKDGQTLTTEEANINELTNLAKKFKDKVLPQLVALQVIS